MNRREALLGAVTAVLAPFGAKIAGVDIDDKAERLFVMTLPEDYQNPSLEDAARIREQFHKAIRKEVPFIILPPGADLVSLPLTHNAAAAILARKVLDLLEETPLEPAWTAGRIREACEPFLVS